MIKLKKLVLTKTGRNLMIYLNLNGSSYGIQMPVIQVAVKMRLLSGSKRMKVKQKIMVIMIQDVNFPTWIEMSSLISLFTCLAQLTRSLKMQGKVKGALGQTISLQKGTWSPPLGIHSLAKMLKAMNKSKQLSIYMLRSLKRNDY